MYVEYLYHFTCERCKNWWSIALDKAGWNTDRMWCPHCGYEQNPQIKENPIPPEAFQQ